MAPTPTVDWIALSLLPGLGPVRLRRALDRFGDPARIAHELTAEQWSAIRGVGARQVATIFEARRKLRRRAEAEARRCERAGIRVLGPDDEDYPAEFEGLADAPIVIYVRGRLPQARVRVSLVGSRAPTAYGTRLAAGLGAGLAARGVHVVSGGARGIDAAAHQGALEQGGVTVAVLGSGLERPYPPEHRDLFDHIAEQGAVVSEFPLGAASRPGHFPRRNRLISALSAAVVVVEAARRSGALNTASHALDQGREVLAIPGPVWSERSAGCHRLIQQGAKLVQNIEDILEELPPPYCWALAPCPPRETPLALEGLTDDERGVLGILDDVEPVHLDELAQRAPVGIAALQAALLGLELRGAVERRPGRYYLLRPQREP